MVVYTLSRLPCYHIGTTINSTYSGWLHLLRYNKFETAPLMTPLKLDTRHVQKYAPSMIVLGARPPSNNYTNNELI